MKRWHRFYLALAAMVLCLVAAFGAEAAPYGERESLTDKASGGIAKAIVNQCTTPDMTEHEKAVALYDWLIDHTTYQKRTTNAGKVLRHGRASCGGYSNAYKLLLSKAGIKAKTINGSIYGLGHMWNLVELGGEWYHVDVRMGDHLKEVEGRYRRFGMCDEQMRLLYNFSGSRSNAYAANYAYKTGQLDSAVAYVKNAIVSRVNAGERIFVIDMTASGAPSTLDDPFNQITVKNALRRLSFPREGMPRDAVLDMSLSDNLLLVRLVEPVYPVEALTSLIDEKINIVVADGNFAALEPIELSQVLQIQPAYATNPMLYWKSRKETVAIIDQQGTLRIVGYGKTSIVVSTTDGSKITKTFDIKVTAK